MIIGSQAIKHWFPDFNRKPKDIDVVKGCYPYNKTKDIRVEFLENEILKSWFKSPVEYCPPDELYTLKISHCFWDLEGVSWIKHMYDIQFLKERGCKLIPELFHKLYDYWNVFHGKNRRSNLNMSAEDFFDNALTFPVNHDYLHELLIQHPYFNNQAKPTYTMVLKDGADVDVSEEKFNLLTEVEKFNLVVEEVMVMALERYGGLYYKEAFNKMLTKFIMYHAPLWESIWIIENHKKLLQNIPFDFISFLNSKITKDAN